MWMQKSKTTIFLTFSEMLWLYPIEFSLSTIFERITNIYEDEVVRSMNSIKGLPQVCSYPLAKFHFEILDIIILERYFEFDLD